MENEPQTWIGVAVLALLLVERFADRFMRWKERRPGKNPGNPNGPKLINQRLETFEQRLDTMDTEQVANWTRQRKADGEMHEKINRIDRAVGTIEGRLDEMVKAKGNA